MSGQLFSLCLESQQLSFTGSHWSATKPSSCSHQPTAQRHLKNSQQKWRTLTKRIHKIRKLLKKSGVDQHWSATELILHSQQQVNLLITKTHFNASARNWRKSIQAEQKAMYSPLYLLTTAKRLLMRNQSANSTKTKCFTEKSMVKQSPLLSLRLT